MKLKLYAVFGLLITFALFSCKTASKLYQKGDYEQAVELAAKKLEKDPHDQKLLDIIQNSYRYAVNDHESLINSYSSSTNELKWEWMYNEYVILQRMYDAINNVPSVNDLVNPTDYSSYLSTYAEKAGDARFNRGMSFMEQNDKQSYRSAYNEFQVALNFKPANRQILSKIDEAYAGAVVNVVVLPADQFGFQFSSYNYNSGTFDDAIIRDLQYNTGNQFVKFYSSWDARSHNIQADEVVDLRFSRMNIGGYRDSKTKREVSKDVVIKEIVYRADSVVKVYGKVTAQISTTTRSMQSEGWLQINISDGNGRYLWSEDVSGNHNWSTSFATYTGDARALSDDDKKLVNRRQESAPDEYSIVRCITDEINNKVLCALRDHFSRL